MKPMWMSLSLVAAMAVGGLHAAEEVEVSIGTNKASVPKAWKEVEPANNMRKAQFQVTKSEGDAEDAELAVFNMPAGGGADANIARWVGQFGGESAVKGKKTVKTAAGTDATVVELEGSYSAMSMQGKQAPKEGYKMLGAIFGDVYIKFTGPAKTINDNKAAFEKMVESYK